MVIPLCVIGSKETQEHTSQRLSQIRYNQTLLKQQSAHVHNLSNHTRKSFFASLSLIEWENETESKGPSYVVLMVLGFCSFIFCAMQMWVRFVKIKKTNGTNLVGMSWLMEGNLGNVVCVCLISSDQMAGERRMYIF